MPHAHHHAPVTHRSAGADQLAAASEVFRAAGDVGRLRLLDRLSAGRQCVTELAEAFAIPMPTISQQLRVLLQAGLVTRTRDGKHQYYELADDHILELVRVALAHADEIH